MHPRSTLAARFWPDVLDESARTSLRSALSAVRRALGPGSDQYLIAGRDEVGLADDSLVWTDLAEFERCVAEGRLDDALALSRGELLAGLYDDWVYECRDEHRGRVAGVLARLAARAESDGDLQKAIGYTRQQVALDPLAEEPQRDLMRRLAAAGDRAAAIKAYERLSQRLRDELRIAPSQATRELAETPGTADGTRQRRDRGYRRSAPAAAVVTFYSPTSRARPSSSGRAGRRRGRAAPPRASSACCAMSRRARRGGGQEPRRRADGRVPQRRQRGGLRGRDPAGGPSPQRPPGRRPTPGSGRAQRRRADPRRGRLLRHSGRGCEAALRQSPTAGRSWLPSCCGRSCGRAAASRFARADQCR